MSISTVPVIVLNLGQSVLRSLDDYTLAAAEIYRHYRQGYNVVAVTSAQGDQSDMLMAEARRIGPLSVILRVVTSRRTRSARPGA